MVGKRCFALRRKEDRGLSRASSCPQVPAIVHASPMRVLIGYIMLEDEHGGPFPRFLSSSISRTRSMAWPAQRMKGQWTAMCFMQIGTRIFDILPRLSQSFLTLHVST